MSSPIPVVPSSNCAEIACDTQSVATDPQAAANEEVDARIGIVTEESDGERNPLWIVVAGLVCMFGVMAAVMALA